jgi:calcineurin-like phosphoesterase family protein
VVGLSGDNIPMPEIWFASDYHFGHKNILTYEALYRPFKTVEEMNEHLINKWNSVVSDQDIVYFLGDFAFGKHNLNIAGLLKGKKRLIMGNHDSYPSRDYLVYFDKLYGIKYWERCILTHIPVHPAQLNDRWVLNVHGHLHSKYMMRNVAMLYNIETDKGPKDISIFSHQEIDPAYFNVSCEQNNLTPFNADVIRQRVKELS